MAILLVFSVGINVWFTTEVSNLNYSLGQEAGQAYSAGFQLPTTAMERLKSEITGFVSSCMAMAREYEAIDVEYWRLKQENSRLEAENSRYQQIEQNYEILAQEYNRLQDENKQYEQVLDQIREEAERARQLETFTGLLSLIFGLLF